MIALLPHCGFLSETSRMLHIGQALRRQGETVVFATHGGPYEAVLREAGEDPQLLTPTVDRERCARFIDDIVNMGRPGVKLMQAEELRQCVQAEAAFFSATKARTVVTGFQLSANLSARVAAIPLVTSHGGAFVGPVFENGLAPIPTTMPIPGTNWLPGWLKRRIANTGPLRMKGPSAFLNEIAAQIRVEPVPSIAALMMGDLTLLTEAPDVLGLSEEQVHAWVPRQPSAFRRNPKVVITGPLFAQLDIEVPNDVARFMDGSEPTVYVVLNSTTALMLHQVVSRVVAAGARVIVGGTIHHVEGLRSDKVVAAQILPSHRIMPAVDLVVGMGGQGTSQCAGASGTPFIGIPMHPEQELNVALVAQQHAGYAISPRHATQQRMTDVVRWMLNDPRFKAGALKVQQIYRQWDGAQRAAQAIIEFLKTQPQAGIPQSRPEPATMAFR
jgi:UDP:flavonoid glycosyltransferase YjiC (YdhE family)